MSLMAISCEAAGSIRRDGYAALPRDVKSSEQLALVSIDGSSSSDTDGSVDDAYINEDQLQPTCRRLARWIASGGSVVCVLVVLIYSSDLRKLKAGELFLSLAGEPRIIAIRRHAVKLD